MDPADAHSVTIPLETLTRDSFAQFGEMLTVVGSPLPHVYGAAIEPYRAGRVQAVTGVEWIFSRHFVREFRVQYLERHTQFTQTMIPLGGDPLIVAVARADAPLQDGLPRIGEVHAFLVPGDAAVNLGLGTWHEVPFPVVDGSVALLTSHAKLSAGWAQLGEDGEIHGAAETDEEKCDVLARAGVRLMIDVSGLASVPSAT